MSWHALSITVLPEAAEAVEFAFNSLDSLGTEIDRLRKSDRGNITVVGYFEKLPDDELLQDELHYALRSYGHNEEAVIDIERHDVPDTDWLLEWKKHWKPVRVGHFLIAPPWEKEAGSGEDGLFLIRIEPNMAFGTGTHETTQLCLQAIEANVNEGDSFLDVGTGTGILAVAAAMLGARPIYACDTDRASVAISRENAALNSVTEKIEFADGPLPDSAPVFDVACANLTVDVILPILPLLLEKSRRTLILSGILAEQEDAALSELRRLGASDFEVDRAGEWIAVTVATGGY